LKRALKTTLWGLGGLALAVMIVAGAAYVWIGSRGDPLPKSHAAGVTLTEVPCAKELTGARCGKIKAPLDYTGADVGTVDVGFVYYPALWSEGPDAPVLNFIDGGPGQILSDDIKESPMALLRLQFRNRAFLMIDARGVGGLSEALRCPVRSQYDLEANEADKIAACAETIGRKRIHFTSANTARDFNLVRRALGITSVDLLAFSYGTAIAPLYAALYPEAVRTITLDGAFQVGPYDDLHLPTFHDAAMRRLRDICARAKNCTYEKTKQNLTQVVAALRQQPRAVRPTGAGFAIPQNRQLDPEALALIMTADTPMRRDNDGVFKIIFPLIGAHWPSRKTLYLLAPNRKAALRSLPIMP
jgi:pimeloyl-ACP methyl ester carboxylesterase